MTVVSPSCRARTHLNLTLSPAQLAHVQLFEISKVSTEGDIMLYLQTIHYQTVSVAAKMATDFQ